MSLNAVQQFVLKTLDQLSTTSLVSLGVPPVNAFITPPVFYDEATAPALYIWGSTGRGHRETFPRVAGPTAPLSTAGTKSRRMTIDVWLSFADSPDNPSANDMFPVLIGAVLHALETVPVFDPSTGQAVQVTDPATGEVSQILEFAEDIDWDYSTVRALEDQRFWRYVCLIRPVVEEWYFS